MFPETSIQQVPPGDELRITQKDGEAFTAYLENIWRRSRGNIDSRAIEVERFFRALGSSAARSDALPQVGSIVPTIKDEEYLKVFRKNTGERKLSVYEHFVADLWIVYCVDSLETITTLKRDILLQLKLDEKELKAIAVENLKRILPPVERHGDGPVYMLTAGGDYVASLLLFDDLWEKLGASMEGDIIAAVPSRDVLLFTSSNSPEGIVNMRESVSRVFESGGYLVSTTMIRRHDGGWKAFS